MYHCNILAIVLPFLICMQVESVWDEPDIDVAGFKDELKTDFHPSTPNWRENLRRTADVGLDLLKNKKKDRLKAATVTYTLPDAFETRQICHG